MRETPVLVQILLTIGFCIGCGMITSIGRAHLGLAQAFGSRYQSIVLLFWCCLGLLVLLLISPPEKSRMPLIALQALFLIIMVRGAEEARFPLRDAIHHGFELRAASMSLVTGVQDAAQLEEVFPYPPLVVQDSRYLRDKRLSIFAERLTEQLGKPLESQYQPASPKECLGAIDSVQLAEEMGSDGFRIKGWAWDARHGRPPRAIVTATDGFISGFGAVGAFRGDIREDPSRDIL